MSSLQMEGKNCIVCGTGACHLCSGCQQVRYCSKAHQKSHWNEHKLVCKCFKVECDATTGHYLVAAKDLEAGAIILKEEPLVVFMKKNEGPVICVGCCRDLDGRAVNCPNCKWPMCGQKKCWGEGSHHELGECSLLKAAGSLVTGDYSKWATEEIYPTLLILRCLSLRQRNPTKWKKLLEFKFVSSPYVKQKYDEFMSKQEFNCDMANLVYRWVPDSSGIIQETLAKLFFLFSQNSFEIKEDDGLFALYYAASMIDHSCVANATKTITNDEKIIIRASVPITKGSRITLRFSKAPLFATTMERQLYLDPTKFNRCACVRCKDPTELGTFASGVYCQKCPNLEGILLSENPLDRGSNWKCGKCSDRKPASFIVELLQKICAERSGLDLHSIPVCEAFISRYGKLLHPHHHYIAHVKLTLCYIYCRSHSRGHNISNEMCDELNKKGALVEELLKLVNALSPGLNSLRGFLLCKKISFLAIKNYKLFLANNDSTEAQSRHNAYREIVEEVQSIFLLEPEDSSERILANIAIQHTPFDPKSFEKLGF